jgi:hypothetical protein
MLETSSCYLSVVGTSLAFEQLVGINPFGLIKVGIDSTGAIIKEDTDPSATVVGTDLSAVVIMAI